MEITGWGGGQRETQSNVRKHTNWLEWRHLGTVFTQLHPYASVTSLYSLHMCSFLEHPSISFALIMQITYILYSWFIFQTICIFVSYCIFPHQHPINFLGQTSPIFAIEVGKTKYLSTQTLLRLGVHVTQFWLMRHVKRPLGASRKVLALLMKDMHSSLVSAWNYYLKLGPMATIL